MNPVVIALIVVLAIVFLVLGWGVATSNGIKRLDLKCKEALADIDVALMKRHDSLTKLLDVVKGYQKHELDTLTQLTSMRSGMAMNERVNATRQMNDLMGRINVVAENYPELKSNTNFQALQDELAGTENRISVARKRYNDSVRTFNTKIKVFPSSIVAGNMGFEKKSYFEIADSARAVPQVQF